MDTIYIGVDLIAVEAENRLHVQKATWQICLERKISRG